MIEYKEIEFKRSGKRAIFCRLEDLLKEFYHETDMENIRPHAQNGEYIIHCPFCKEEGHTKHKLYIKDDLTEGNCFVCGRAYINIDDNVCTDYRVNDYLGLGSDGFKVVPLSDDGPWTLGQYYSEFDDFSEKGLAYLKGRHQFMEQLWEPLGFKFINDNVVMPFKYHGEVIYYQIRFSDATQKDDIRYYFPPMPPGTKPPYIIENGDCKKIIIVEGVYDAIAALIQAPDYTPLAVLGSSITPYQVEFLREYMPEKILIWMDETKISMKIARLLGPILNYCPIHIVPSYGPDPEEVMKERLRTGKRLQWIPGDWGERRSIIKYRLPNVF